MNNANEAAKKIVDELFELGDEHNLKTHRIEFKVGGFNNERGTGGMCRESLVRWLTDALERNIKTTKRKIKK